MQITNTLYPIDIVEYIERDIRQAIFGVELLKLWWSLDENDITRLQNSYGLQVGTTFSTLIISVIHATTMAISRLLERAQGREQCCFEQLKDALISSDNSHERQLGNDLRVMLDAIKNKGWYKKLIISRGHVIAHRNRSIERLQDELQPEYGDLLPAYDFAFEVMERVQKLMKFRESVSSMRHEAVQSHHATLKMLIPTIEESQFASMLLRPS